MTERILYQNFIKPKEQTMSFSCGPMSLHIVYKAFGLDLPETRIASELGTDLDGTNWKSMVEHPKRYGFDTFFYKGADYHQLEMFDRIGYPMIVGWMSDRDHEEAESHFSPVRRAKAEHIMLSDPSYGNLYTLKVREFIPKWYDEEVRRGLLVIAPPEHLSIPQSYGKP